MLRIERITTGRDSLLLSLGGRLVGPWVEELRRSSEPAIAAGITLTLDLSDVSFVDQAGAELLRRLSAHHAVLLSCSRFVAEQLKGWERGHAACGRTHAG